MWKIREFISRYGNDGMFINSASPVPARHLFESRTQETAKCKLNTRGSPRATPRHETRNKIRTDYPSRAGRVKRPGKNVRWQFA